MSHYVLFKFEMTEPKYHCHNLDYLQADLSFVFVPRADVEYGPVQADGVVNANDAVGEDGVVNVMALFTPMVIQCSCNSFHHGH